MNENPYGMRSAGPDDGEALFAFVLRLYRQDEAQEASPRKIAALVQRCLDRDSAIAGIVTGPTGIEASVGAIIDEFDYTDDPHMMVKWFGVAPAFIRTNYGSRLMGYVRWLHESLARASEKPMPVFLSTLTTTNHRSRVLLLQRQAPQVGALHAFGCLPGTSFLTPDRFGRGRKWTPEASGGADAVRTPDRVHA